MLCKYGMWMVCGSNTPPDEGGQLPPPRRLGAVPTHTSETRKCQINTFKNSSYSPFEIRICWEKVSTSSSSVSMSFIFLPIVDTLPHRQPPLSPHATIGWISSRTRVHMAETNFKSKSKLCSCILKTAQTTNDVQHIQTLCNFAERFPTRFHFNFTLLSSNCARRRMTVSLGQTRG